MLDKYCKIVIGATDQCGKSGKHIDSKTIWALDEMVILHLMESLPPKVNCHVFMVNYFTSFGY